MDASPEPETRLSYPSMAIANEFLRKPGALNNVTQMQLQKLTYIAHGWNLAINGEPLASDPVHAWDFGPVFPDLYNHAKYFGSMPINRLITDSDQDKYKFFVSSDRQGTPYQAELNSEELDVLNRVWRKYKSYDAFKLSDLTHQPGTPWYETYFKHGKSARIPNEMIRRHYLELAQSATS